MRIERLFVSCSIEQSRKLRDSFDNGDSAQTYVNFLVSE